MASSLETAAGNMVVGMSGSDSPGAKRQEKAIALAENDGDLDSDEFVDAVELFTAEPRTAISYVAIKNPNARTRFLRKQIEKKNNMQ